MSKEIVIEVDLNGSFSFIHDDSLSGLMKHGEAVIHRASHVEWKSSGWFVDLAPVGGGTFEGFQSREEALRFEHDWLIQHGLPLPKETQEWLKSLSAKVQLSQRTCSMDEELKLSGSTQAKTSTTCTK